MVYFKLYNKTKEWISTEEAIANTTLYTNIKGISSNIRVTFT